MIIGIILGILALAIFIWGPVDHLILSGICAGAVLVWGLISLAVMKAVKSRAPQRRNTNPEEKERLRKAAELDKANKTYNRQAEEQYQKEYQPLYNEALKNLEQGKNTDPQIEKCRKEYEDAILQLLKSQAAVDDSTVLTWEDKNLETVDFLIKRLESRRADTIKEALNQMDEVQRRAAEKKARDEREAEQRRIEWNIQQARMRIEMQQQAQERLDETMRRLRNEEQTRKHQEEMEYLRKRELSELEEINRKLGRN